MKDYLIVAHANFWHHLLLTIVFNNDKELCDKDEKCNFEGFCVFEKEAYSELFEYAKTRNVL